MFSNISGKSVSDRLYNEDTYGYHDKLLFVIDGVTGLGENDFMGLGDDAKWFVENVANALMKMDECESIVEYLSNVCRNLYGIYQKRSEYLDENLMPRGCISLFRVHDQKIEYYGLGDCVGIVEFVDGTYEVLYDKVITDLDNQVIDEMVRISKEKGISPIEARRYIQDDLIANRSLLNKKEGYYLLELTGKGLPYAIQKSWDLSRVKRIACMSDGFYEVMQYGLYPDIASLMDAIFDNHEKVFANLYQMQQDDDEGYKVPRFKLRDDTTLVLAEVKEANQN
ncbi:MAG: hypothetical protein PUF50_00815 [Erysipelotrichaceae bacterium]|nr:hypothetical protein [Erysipelotrichaceae bacterium]